MSDRIPSYEVPVVSADKAQVYLEKHFSSPPRYGFRTKDLVPVVQFTVGYFFDALQEIFDKAMLGGDQIDIKLDSGWSARSVDIGHIWRRHIEFTSPSDPTRGFLLQGELDMVETNVSATLDFSTDDYIDKIISGLNTQDDLIKANKSSSEFLPENSVRIDEYAVFPFAVSERWYETPKAGVYECLLKSNYITETFKSHPQVSFDGQPLQVDRGTTSITAAGGTFDVLQVLSEFVRAYAPEASREALQKHSEADYTTLFQEDLDLLTAVRSTFQSSELPSPALNEMITHMWQRAGCEDVLRNLHFITESATALIDMGHTSSDNAFDCNDGRTVAYAYQDNDITSIVTEWEEWSSSIQFTDDRIKVSKVEFETGRHIETVVEFEHSNGEIRRLNEIVPYDDTTSSVMTRALVDLSSVHCYVVSDRELENDGGSPQP